MPALPRFPEHWLLLCGLVLTRIIGWGSTYYAPSVLASYLARDLGLSGEVVFGGITILLIVGATAAPAIGRHLDSHGTRRSMCFGAVVCALGLALLSFAQGPISYLATWFVIGIGHALMLANVGNVTVAQLMGERTRRVIGVMMLATGLASSVFWPLTATLSAAYGWRQTLLIFAAIQILVVLPIHLMIPSCRAKLPAPGQPVSTIAEEGRVPPVHRRTTFWLLATAFSASGVVSWGLPLHLIGLMQGSGMSQATTVAIATLNGPATLIARLVDVLAGEKLPVERVALAGLLLGPLACLLMAAAPGWAPVAIAFSCIFSAAMGVISVARATLPLSLFGRRAFATMLGKLTVPQNLAFATAPLLFAVLIERFGATITLLLSAAIQAIAFIAMLVLVRRLVAIESSGSSDRIPYPTLNH
ncbi:MFS transporter [Bosea sp. BK604]|uniref:MFS transporter n=1 Tax=Bosea sp. BK604 TaxID=2512180 RepID=UPI0010D1172E|nr:MFS transporter [Bosea sp. BK604]TCR69952.1 putative MFS family arabinose efflux permease [Bosea sp. BK604]